MSALRRAVTAALAGIVLTALVVHQRIDDLLSALHDPGDRAHGIGDLAPLLDLPDVERTRGVLGVWLEADQLRPPPPAVEDLTDILLALDCTLALAVPGLFFLLLTYVKGRLEDAPASERRKAYLRIVKVAIPCLAVVAAADLVENLGLARMVAVAADDGPNAVGAFWPTVTWGASILKWGSLAACVVPLVASGTWLALGEPSARHRSLRTLAAVRVQVVLVAAFALLLLGPIAGPQTADVILRWVHEPGDGVAAALAVLGLGGVLYVSCRLLLWFEQERTPVEMKWWLLLAWGAPLVVLGLVFDQVRGLWPLGAVLIVVAGLSLPIKEFDDKDPREKLGPAPSLAPALVAAAPVVIAAIAVVRAAVVEWIIADDSRYRSLILIALCVETLGWALVAVGRTHPAKPDKAAWGALGLAAFLGAIIAWRVLENPWRTADFLGLLGIFSAFGALLAVVAFALVLLEHVWRPPPAMAALGAKRLPILLVLAAWTVAAALQDKGGYHDARLEQRVAGVSRMTLAEAWKRWVGERKWPRHAGDGRAAVPLVLVATSGGGIRAAYWTARAMECAIDGEPAGKCGPRRGKGSAAVFAASGISGGSVGLVEWTASHLTDQPTSEWVDDRLGEDFLAPTWAWTLYADLPSALLHVDFGPDRAEVLERAWEQSWRPRDTTPGELFSGQGPESTGVLTRRLLETSQRTDLPLLLLSSTSVRDGCRINISALDADRALDGDTGCLSPAVGGGGDADAALAATEDVFDLCEDQDLRLSTAALLSARFPLVSPSGRLGPPGCEGGPLFAVDGGYYDNSGASPMLELWPRLAPRVGRFNRRHRRRCVVPFFLQLDNSYIDSQPPEEPSRPFEFVAPIRTFGGVQGGREEGERQAAELAFDRRSFGSVKQAYLVNSAGEKEPIESRYAHLYPRSHPGTTAPLGWTLSRPSMDSLQDQLEGEGNRPVREDIARWFGEGLRCPARDRRRQR